MSDVRASSEMTGAPTGFPPPPMPFGGGGVSWPLNGPRLAAAFALAAGVVALWVFAQRTPGPRTAESLEAAWAGLPDVQAPFFALFDLVSGYIAGLERNANIDATRDVFGVAPGAVLAWAAIMVSAHALFLVGRFAVGPLWSRYGWKPSPPKGPPKPPSKFVRALLFVLPPPPMGKPGQEPITQKRGLIMATVLRILPPPGPAQMTLAIDALLGASKMPLWKFSLGTAIGAAIQIGFALAFGNVAAPMPAPPSSGPLLILFLLGPIIIVPIVRLAGIFLKKALRPAR